MKESAAVFIFNANKLSKFPEFLFEYNNIKHVSVNDVLSIVAFLLLLLLF